MKKLEKRALICLLMAGLLLLGLLVYVGKYLVHGDEWATSPVNTALYSGNRLAGGKIVDRNGVKLATNKKKTISYNKDEELRRATLHAVGDMGGNIATAAETAFREKLIGYNLITGTYDLKGRGNELKLTIDAEVNRTAYEALDGRNGLVGVYNYETGEVICMVSTPTMDPQEPPDEPEDGTYINKFLSGRLTPGSIFKLVTAAAAIETVEDYEDFSYTCTGSREVNGQYVTCSYAHGEVDFDSALSHSCNCAYSVLAEMVGADQLEAYTKKAGLKKAYDINGIKNAKGKFSFPAGDTLSVDWAGIGQWEDQLNPCSMMVFMGAIADGGKSAVPRLIRDSRLSTTYTKQMIEEETAERLSDMMKKNVVNEYGENTFPGLDIYAKTGTAEVEGRSPNSWLAGFVRDEGCPYAFIVCVENSGAGIDYAAPAANRVLQKLVHNR